MKTLCLSLILAARLFAQGAGAGTIASEGIVLDGNSTYDNNGTLAFFDYFFYKITRDANGVKTFTFTVYHCLQAGVRYEAGRLFPGSSLTVGGEDAICTADSQAMALAFAPVQEAIGDFLNDNSDAPHKIVYGLPTTPNVAIYRPHAVITPATPPDPYMVFLDGFGSTVYKYDLATASVLAQVDVPEGAGGPLALRPTATPPENEVWIATGGSQITVTDFSAKKILGSIGTSFPVSANPVAILFSNGGATAFEALSFSSPDSAGNLGAVAVFNAATRALTSTLLLKSAPAVFVMSPDGLTAYLLDGGGKITYYDCLSGTADFTTSTFTPGVNGGYSGDTVFVHPDGTRLFWHIGTFIESFDLALHKVTAQYPTGLPTTSATSIQMSPDGNLITMSNGAGASVTVETRYGRVVATGQDAGATQAITGPAR